jgi:hypothetical protein
MAHESDQLSLKWTFIALKDNNQIKAKRSSSEPPKKGPYLIEYSEHDHEYLTTLWDRASKLQSNAGTISTAQESGLDHESIADSFEEKSENSGHEPTTNEDGQITAVTEDESFSPKSTLQLSKLLASPTDSALSGESGELLRCNFGSAGHPEFCNRPCIFFPLGQCTGGKSCNFCHEDHPHRPAHLDKINRTTLRSLPYSDRKNLLLSAIKERSAKQLSVEKLRLFLQLLRMPLLALCSFLQECSDVEAAIAKEGITRFRLASGVTSDPKLN